MKIYIYFLLFIIPLKSFPQINISGKVIDEDGKPIAYANVIFPNSTKGTSTDNNGRFSLYSEKKYREIEVSFIGYMTKRISLKGMDLKNLTVVLVEGEELDEVVVVGKPKKALSKKENPAYSVLQKIWKNKRKKGLHNVSAYQYKKHTINELGLNNLDTIFLRETLGRDYDTVKKILSEKKHKNTFSMPIYLKEKLERVYTNNELKKSRTDIEIEHSQGIGQKGFGLERFSKAFDDFDIYDNTYIILNQPFVSPLSEFGYGTYHYVLNDTILEKERKFYQIFFFPKTDEDLVLEGNFIVDSKAFIVKSIEMKTTPKTNLNMVRGMFFEKHFNIENDSVYFLRKEIREGDFTLITKSDNEKGLYVRSVMSYSDVILNQPQPDLFYDEEPNEDHKRKDFLPQSENKLAGSQEFIKTQALIEKISNTPKVKSLTGLIDFLGSGYFSIAKHFQAGTYWQFYETNDVEKNRFRLGFRSFVTTEDRFRTYFYGAYGMRDKKIKYGVSAKYLLAEHPRIAIGGSYQNDYLQLGRSGLKSETDLTFRTLSNAVINRGENYFLTHTHKAKVVASYQPHSNLELAIFGIYQYAQPADKERFDISFKKIDNILSSYSDFNSGFSITYTPNRNVYGKGVEQRYGKKLHSTYAFKYTKAHKKIFDGNFDYNRVDFLLKKSIPLWSFGLLRTTFEAGKIWGEAPLTALAPTPTNQSYSTVANTFALLDYYDFISDTYLNGYFEHHFNGIILNKIPFLKKANLRSLLFARFTYGTISEKNKMTNATNLMYNAPEKLYWEYGLGIENIGVGNFRFFRVDFVWRNDFNDVNGVRNPKFGIRVGFIPVF